MKKLITLLMALVMCVSLVACGGVDKQPAIDAFNKASAAFNEVADVLNANPDAYDQEVFDTMNEMADVLNQHGELLKSDQEIEEEKLNEMIEWYGTVEDWVADIKADLGM
ncbi:MAG: hypothetical protein ACI4AD_01600 [Roseburia sp.]